jgi:DedD protein
MRDAGRVKNRFEVKLDSNQVFSVFAFLAVYSALVFVLGVVFGRSRRPVEDSVAPPATVAVLDATPTPRRIEDRLAAAQPKATEEPEIPIGDVMNHLENATPAGAVPTPTQKAASTQKPAPTPRPAVSPKLLVGEPAPSHAPEATPAASAVPESTATGAYTLQVVAYNEKAQADGAVAGLKAKGLDAYAVSAQVSGKGTVYRVRIGRYATRTEAETAATRIAALQPGTKSLIVPFQ